MSHPGWEWWCETCREAYAPCWRELNWSEDYGIAACWKRVERWVPGRGLVVEWLRHSMVRRRSRPIDSCAPCCHCPEPALAAYPLFFPSRFAVTNLATGERREVVVWACSECGDSRAARP